MPRLTRIRRLAILFLIVAGCLMVIGGGSPAVMPATKQTTSPEGWSVETLRAETIVESRLRITPISATLLAGTTVDVTLRNDYDKRITALVACVDETFYTRSYVSKVVEDSQKLESRDSDRFLYPKPKNNDERIKIVAVLLSDGTADGDQRQIQYILDERRGYKMQLFRMLPHLQQFADQAQISSKATTASVALMLATIKSVASSLPIKTDDGTPMSQGLESGLIHGRAYIVRSYVSELEEALANEKVETWFDFLGQKQTLRHSPNQNFRMKFEDIRQDFAAYLSRL